MDRKVKVFCSIAPHWKSHKSAMPSRNRLFSRNSVTALKMFIMTKASTHPHISDQRTQGFERNFGFPKIMPFIQRMPDGHLPFTCTV